MHQMHIGVSTLASCRNRDGAYVSLIATKQGAPAPNPKDLNMAYATQTSTAGYTFGDRIAALRDTFADYTAKRSVYRRTLNELGALNNRELADLGLSRSGIRRVALEAAKLV